MSVRAIEPDHIQDRLALRRKNHLAYAKQRRAARDVEQLCGLRVCGRGVYLFVSVRELQAVVTLEQGKKRAAFQGRARDIGKVFSGEITGLKRKRFVGRLPQPLDRQETSGCRQAQARRNLVLAVDGRQRKDSGAWRQVPTSHLLGESGELVEMNLGLRHESPRAAPPLDQTFALKFGQRMARGHQAHLMQL